MIQRLFLISRCPSKHGFQFLRSHSTKATIINGKELSSRMKSGFKDEIKQIRENTGKSPALGIIMVGDKPESAVYVRSKSKACNQVGIVPYDYFFPEDVSQSAVIRKIDEMNKDPDIDGILVQMPLPCHLDTRSIIERVSPAKDVDGLHPFNLGELAMNTYMPRLVPCTPLGIMELLKEAKVDLEGKVALVIGRSNLVGIPITMLLRKANATVIQCHSKTRDLCELLKQADVIIAACGVPQMIKGSCMKDNCVVIDVGINYISDESRKSGYRIVGDVDYESAINKCSAITPVPGGVGPMTIAMLLKNVLKSFRKRVET